MERYITEEMVRELGVDLGNQDVNSLLDHLNETLEERVGTEIADALDEDKLQTLLDMQETADEATVAEWMKANVPEFEEVVQDEIDILLGEVAENAGDVNKSV